MSIPQVGDSVIEHQSQLAEYLAEGSKEKRDWKIGTEHEKFVYDRKSFLPLPYSGKCSIQAILEKLKNAYGWNPVMENHYLIGLEKNGANESSLLKNVLVRGVNDLRQLLSEEMEEGNTYIVSKKILNKFEIYW